MAVQKSKRTRSKNKIRRSNKKLKFNTLSIDYLSKENHIYHRITKNGYYKGKLQITKNK